MSPPQMTGGNDIPATTQIINTTPTINERIHQSQQLGQKSLIKASIEKNANKIDISASRSSYNDFYAKDAIDKCKDATRLCYYKASFTFKLRAEKNRLRIFSRCVDIQICTIMHALLYVSFCVCLCMCVNLTLCYCNLWLLAFGEYSIGKQQSIQIKISISRIKRKNNKINKNKKKFRKKH